MRSPHLLNDPHVFVYIYIYMFFQFWILLIYILLIYIIPDIGIMVRVFANGPGSIPGRVIPKTLKMVLDASLLNTHHYKVRIKGKVEKSWERCSALPYTPGVVAIEKGAFGSPSTMVANFILLTYLYIRGSLNKFPDIFSYGDFYW